MSNRVQTWLRPNRRVLAMAMILPALLLVGGIAAIVTGRQTGGSLVAALGWVFAFLGGLAVWGLATQMLRPRIGYEPGFVVLNLRAGRPIRVPLAAVEGFLLGHGPAGIRGERGENAETATVVVRIAERAEAWQRLDVKPALASWCDGYVTIRGTWCEPLSVAVIERLNQRLSEAKHK